MNERVAVEKLLHAYFDAFQQSKWEDFGALLDEEFTYVTDNCTQQRKSEFLSFLASNHWPVRSYQISNLRLLPSSEQDQIVALYDVMFVGTTSTLQAIETTVFRRRKDGAYVVVHSHTSNKMTS